MSSELKNDGLTDSEWCEVSIADLCLNIYSGGTPKSTEPKYFENGVIPWLKTKEVNYSKITETENFITTDGLKNSSAKLVPVNSVIVAMYGNGDTAGRVAINKIELTTNQACCNLVIDPEKADYRFVYYYLMSQYSKLVDLKNGGAQQNLNSKLIKDFPIQTPELATQGEIGAFLESLDDRIALLRETNATLEAIAQALFKSWFVDFDPVHANAGTQSPSLPPEIQALFPATFTDSPQGPIPEGWSFESLASIMDIAGGTQPPASEFIDSLKEGYIRLIQIRDYETDSHLTYVPLTKNLRQTSSKDIMIARYGASVGRICWGLDGAYNVALIKVVCEENHREFLRTYLQSNQFQMRLAAVSGRSAQAGFNKGDIASFKLVFPCNKIFEQYQNSVWPLREKILHHRAQAIALEGLRDTLLPRLISGQLRLPELEQAVAAITD